MKLTDNKLSEKEIKEIREEYGSYVKMTADLESGLVVMGTKLHADGETILLEKRAKPDNIWGGGINLKDKIIDTTAVLNIRPRLGNDSVEILDPKRRKKFISLIKRYFGNLWR